jgi:hypothetical protein
VRRGGLRLHWDPIMLLCQNVERWRAVECGDVDTDVEQLTAFWSVCKSAIICANCRLSVEDISLWNSGKGWSVEIGIKDGS